MTTVVVHQPAPLQRTDDDDEIDALFARLSSTGSSSHYQDLRRIYRRLDRKRDDSPDASQDDDDDDSDEEQEVDSSIL